MQAVQLCIVYYHFQQGWQNSGFFEKTQPSGVLLGFINFYILLLLKLFLRHFTKKEAIKVTFSQ